MPSPRCSTQSVASLLIQLSVIMVAVQMSVELQMTPERATGLRNWLIGTYISIIWNFAQRWHYALGGVVIVNEPWLWMTSRAVLSVKLSNCSSMHIIYVRWRSLHKSKRKNWLFPRTRIWFDSLWGNLSQGPNHLIAVSQYYRRLSVWTATTWLALHFWDYWIIPVGICIEAVFQNLSWPSCQ